MIQTRIGISGWRYGPWRKTFYPPDLVQRSELEFASRQFNSIEINGSFYSLQHVASWQQWYDATPRDFVFSIKGGRFITHMKKLTDVDTPLANFFAQGILSLKDKLGPILWQFPPNFAFNPARFEKFFELLPRDMNSALKLARRCDPRMEGRSYLRVDQNHTIRYAVEIRHDSFKSRDFVNLLRRYGVALVVADTAGKWPFMEDVTADFVYARLHGDEELYVSGYTSAVLDQWADRIHKWRKQRLDVYVYFDNDVKVRAPFDAIGLAQRVDGFVPLNTPKEPVEESTEEARSSWPVVARRSMKTKNMKSGSAKGKTEESR